MARARGAVASPPISMRGALGSNPSDSMVVARVFCANKADLWQVVSGALRDLDLVVLGSGPKVGAAFFGSGGCMAASVAHA